MEREWAATVPRWPESIEAVNVPRAHDIGRFEVRRALPADERQMIGPFIFFDQMGPGGFMAGHGLDVRPHPHIGLSTLVCSSARWIRAPLHQGRTTDSPPQRPRRAHRRYNRVPVRPGIILDKHVTSRTPENSPVTPGRSPDWHPCTDTRVFDHRNPGTAKPHSRMLWQIITIAPRGLTTAQAPPTASLAMPVADNEGTHASCRSPRRARTAGENRATRRAQPCQPRPSQASSEAAGLRSDACYCGHRPSRIGWLSPSAHGAVHTRSDGHAT
jgi:hypothetical protein